MRRREDQTQADEGTAAVQTDFGLHAHDATPPTVHQMLLTLEKVGLITRRPGVARCVKVMVDRERLPRLDPADDQTVKTTVPRY